MIPAPADSVPNGEILRGYPKAPAISKSWDLALVFQTFSASWQWMGKVIVLEQHHVLPHPKKSNGKAPSGLLKCLSDEVVFIYPACLSHPLDGRPVETAHYR